MLWYYDPLAYVLYIAIVVAGICFVVWFINKQRREEREREEILYRTRDRDNRGRNSGKYNDRDRRQGDYERDDKREDSR